MPHTTKPKPPSRSAPRAQDPVKVGKARTAYKTPVTAGLYHALPSARIKPKEPIECGQYSRYRTGPIRHNGPTVRRPGGPMRHRHRPHGIMFADQCLLPTIGHGGDLVVPTPTTSIKAYGLIFVVEAIYFGKEFLRMAGIVKMLHILQPPYGARSYIVVCQPNQSSIVIIRS